MRVVSLSKADLERWLLRRGLGRLAEGRPRCEHCRRTPLVGENVFLYDRGKMLCALCRRRRQEDPLAARPMRGAEWGHAVRPAAAA